MVKASSLPDKTPYICMCGYEADARLIELAPTAPHECSDPDCPGNVNRRKLLAFDGLLALAQKIADRGHSADCDPWPEKECTCLVDEARTVIAKAKQ
jgi:hypothetical protein